MNFQEKWMNSHNLNQKQVYPGIWRIRHCFKLESINPVIPYRELFPAIIKSLQPENALSLMLFYDPFLRNASGSPTIHCLINFDTYTVNNDENRSTIGQHLQWRFQGVLNSFRQFDFTLVDDESVNDLYRLQNESTQQFESIRQVCTDGFMQKPTSSLYFQTIEYVCQGLDYPIMLKWDFKPAQLNFTQWNYFQQQSGSPAKWYKKSQRYGLYQGKISITVPDYIGEIPAGFQSLFQNLVFSPAASREKSQDSILNLYHGKEIDLVLNFNNNRKRPIYSRLLRNSMTKESREYFQEMNKNQTGTTIGYEADSPGNACRILTPNHLCNLSTILLGETGCGKSTVSLDKFASDVAQGKSCILMCPHGDLAQAALTMIPPGRTDDVIYIDAASKNQTISINPLDPTGLPEDDHRLISELVMMLIGLYGDEIFGPRLQQMFANGAQTLLTFSRLPGMAGFASFALLNKLYTNAQFRTFIVDKIRDTADIATLQYWDEFILNQSPKNAAEILDFFTAKFDIFLKDPVVRRLVCSKASINISQMIAENKNFILIVNLGKGELSEFNANLIGRIILTRIMVGCYQRAALKERKPLAVYLDEFANFCTSSSFASSSAFANNSIAALFSESRKFGMELTCVMQYLDQIPQLTRQSMMSNAGTRILFNLSDKDAESFFGKNKARATQIPKHHALVLFPRGEDKLPNEVAITTYQRQPVLNEQQTQDLITLSQQKYSRDNAVIDEEYNMILKDPCEYKHIEEAA